MLRLPEAACRESVAEIDHFADCVEWIGFIHSCVGHAIRGYWYSGIIHLIDSFVELQGNFPSDRYSAGAWAIQTLACVVFASHTWEFSIINFKRYSCIGIIQNS